MDERLAKLYMLLIGVAVDQFILCLNAIPLEHLKIIKNLNDAQPTQTIEHTSMQQFHSKLLGAYIEAKTLVDQMAANPNKEN